MTTQGAAIAPAKSDPLTTGRAAEILAKLAVISADILDLDDRLTRLDSQHRDHSSGGGQ